MEILTGQANGQKNGQMNRRNYTNFERNLAVMVIYVPVKFEFDWKSVLKLESGNENMDGQTDGHRTHQSNRRVGYTQPT